MTARENPPDLQGASECPTAAGLDSVHTQNPSMRQGSGRPVRGHRRFRRKRVSSRVLEH